MHFYSKHIGDWVNDTGGLTATEEGVYGRLTDQYFKREGPLPLDQKELYRLARAFTKDERKAVDYVVPAYFVREADGWHREKCDGAIAAYQQRAETARQNGQHGGRPKNRNKNRSKTESEPSGFSVGPDQEPGSKANHKPVTINHALDPSDLPHPSDADVVVPPVDAFPEPQSLTESARASVAGSARDLAQGESTTQGAAQAKEQQAIDLDDLGARGRRQQRTNISASVREVFEHWQAVMNHRTAKLTDKRADRIAARLRQGYTVSDLMRAVDGCRVSPFHQGQNEHGTVHDDIELICRDGEHVERFRNAATGSAASRLSPVGRQAAYNLAGWAARYDDEEKANGTEGP